MSAKQEADPNDRIPRPFSFPMSRMSANPAYGHQTARCPRCSQPALSPRRVCAGCQHEFETWTPTHTEERMDSAHKGKKQRFYEWLHGWECRLSSRWAAQSHHRLFQAQWKMGHDPEWFDHRIDLFHQWTATGDSMWLERGVYGSLALKGGAVLELGCGDGFNAKHFYALRSRSVVACDFDPTALATAREKNAAPNVDYRFADIRTDMPVGVFENVVWDAMIEHFTPVEIEALMGNIKRRLTPDGILSGYTLVERQDGKKAIHQHEYEFKDMHDLKRFLDPHFQHVQVFETMFPSRHNLYFWASDGPIPFAPDWRHGVSTPVPFIPPLGLSQRGRSDAP